MSGTGPDPGGWVGPDPENDRNAPSPDPRAGGVPPQAPGWTPPQALGWPPPQVPGWPPPQAPGWTPPQAHGWVPPSDPVEREALLRLSRTGWRLRHSAWVLLPIVGLGLLTWVAFAYVGVRARRARWWGAAVVYGIGISASLVLFGSSPQAQGTTVRDDIAGTLFLGVWAGGIVHALIANSAWLTWRARYPWNRFGGAPGMGVSGQGAPGLAPLPPPVPGRAPWEPTPPTPPTAPAVPPPTSWEPGPSLDVNRADAGELAALPGLTPALVERALAVRSARGGFASVEEFAREAGLQPHEFVRLAPRLTCSPPSPPPASGSGRILDI